MATIDTLEARTLEYGYQVGQLERRVAQLGANLDALEELKDLGRVETDVYIDRLDMLARESHAIELQGQIIGRMLEGIDLDLRNRLEALVRRIY